MKIRSLTLTNFRGFSQLDLHLDPQLTVLVGVNGSGKTSLLDAIAMLWSHLVAGIVDDRSVARNLAADDIRVSTGGALIRLEASLEPLPATPTLWNLSIERVGYAVRSAATLDFLDMPIAAAKKSLESSPSLPLLVYYPTNRNALDIPTRIRETHEFDPLSAFDGALDAGERNFRHFFEWFRDEEDVENEETLRGGGGAGRSPLGSVRKAIEQLVPGVKDIRIERRPQRMILTKNNVRLDVAQLSDGEKCLLALVGDLARRMAIAAPTDPEPLERPAIVLIDEIDLHLHPGLQRTLLPRLRQVFPNVQFVTTTHSPQVLSSVLATHVRVLESFQVRSLDRETFRRDTNRILSSVFGDPGRPPEVATKLNALRDAIDAEEYRIARALVAELHTLLPGGQDPDVLFYEGLLPPEPVEGES